MRVEQIEVRVIRVKKCGTCGRIVISAFRSIDGKPFCCGECLNEAKRAKEGA